MGRMSGEVFGKSGIDVAKQVEDALSYMGEDGVVRTVDNAGRKEDKGKLPWHLLPLDAIDDILAVLRFGAEKYGERNWERGMDMDRPFDALMRHASSWYQGHDYDPETGLRTLAHAACCVLFLLAYEIRGTGKDSRPSWVRAKPKP